MVPGFEPSQDLLYVLGKHSTINVTLSPWLYISGSMIFFLKHRAHVYNRAFTTWLCSTASKGWIYCLVFGAHTSRWSEKERRGCWWLGLGEKLTEITLQEQALPEQRPHDHGSHDQALRWESIRDNMNWTLKGKRYFSSEPGKELHWERYLKTRSREPPWQQGGWRKGGKRAFRKTPEQRKKNLIITFVQEVAEVPQHSRDPRAVGEVFSALSPAPDSFWHCTSCSPLVLLLTDDLITISNVWSPQMDSFRVHSSAALGKIKPAIFESPLKFLMRLKAVRKWHWISD